MSIFAPGVNVYANSLMEFNRSNARSLLEFHRSKLEKIKKGKNEHKFKISDPLFWIR